MDRQVRRDRQALQEEQSVEPPARVQRNRPGRFSLFQSLLNRFCLVEMALNYRCGFLDQILKLGGLRDTRRFGGQIENSFMHVDFGVDVRTIEVLSFGR